MILSGCRLGHRPVSLCDLTISMKFSLSAESISNLDVIRETDAEICSAISTTDRPFQISSATL